MAKKMQRAWLVVLPACNLLQHHIFALNIADCGFKWFLPWPQPPWLSPLCGRDDQPTTNESHCGGKCFSPGLLFSLIIIYSAEHNMQWDYYYLRFVQMLYIYLYINLSIIVLILLEGWLGLNVATATKVNIVWEPETQSSLLCLK